MAALWGKIKVEYRNNSSSINNSIVPEIPEGISDKTTVEEEEGNEGMYIVIDTVRGS